MDNLILGLTLIFCCITLYYSGKLYLLLKTQSTWWLMLTMIFGTIMRTVQFLDLVSAKNTMLIFSLFWVLLALGIWGVYHSVTVFIKKNGTKPSVDLKEKKNG